VSDESVVYLFQRVPERDAPPGAARILPDDFTTVASWRSPGFDPHLPGAHASIQLLRSRDDVESVHRQLRADPARKPTI
jgi:hypothetical protein